MTKEKSQRLCADCGTAFDLDRPSSPKRYCNRKCSAKAQWRSKAAVTRGQRYINSRQGKREFLGGLYVRSSWEANFALICQEWQREGRIIRWEYEPEYFEFPVKRGNRFYLPDFKLTFPDESFEYHEVKGYMDKKSQTKLKRFAKYYPELTLVLVDSAAYRKLAAKYKPLLAHWES